MLPPTPSSSEPLVHLPVIPQDDVDDFLEEIERATANLRGISIAMSKAEAERHLAVLDQGTGPLTWSEMRGLSVPVVESMFDADVDPCNAALQVSLSIVYGLGTEPESIATQIAFGREAADRIAERLLRGDASLVPDEVRMRLATTVLRRAAALSPEQFRPPVLCTIAWLMWARGRRVLALHYLAEALRIDPTHALAARLTGQFSVNEPAWIRPYDV